MLRLFAVAFAALQFMSGAWAGPEVAPPAWPAETHAVPNIKTDPVRSLKMGTLEVVLEKTPLTAVIDATGLGEIDAAGTADTAQKIEPAAMVSWVCYTISSAQPAERIWLTSGGMGGGSVINGVTATQLPPGKKAVPECPELPEKFKPVRFANDVWLGSSAGEIEAVLGEPARKGDTWSYNFHGVLRDLDIVASLRVRFVEGRAAAIAASHAGWSYQTPMILPAPAPTKR